MGVFRKRAKLFFARNRRKWLPSKMDRALVRWHKAYENLNYNFEENGEHFVLQKLNKILPIETIFDVGANKGEWSKIASEIFPKSKIYSFELVPTTYQRLIETVRPHQNITTYAIGLSDAEGKIPVYHSTDKSGVATCVSGFSEKFHGYQPEVSNVNVTTGDIFCSQHKIETINFLKVDVEGYEPQVLKGFQGLLESENINIIQFEYGYINIAVNFLLKNFYDYLRSYNFRIGKIYPNYVDFRDYRFKDENFYGPNYLAVHSSLTKVIKALKS